MSLPYRERQRLRDLEDSLRRSDPRLENMHAIFVRLCAGEGIPVIEQLRRPGRLGRLLDWTTSRLRQRRRRAIPAGDPVSS